MTKPLTVLQLLPALNAGGVERAAIEISSALVQAGHRAIVMSAGGRLLPALEATGAEHVQANIGKKSLWSLRHLSLLRHWFKQVDIVHARSRFPAWLAWLAWRSLGASRPRWVTTVHGLNSVGVYSGIMMRGERVIVVSNTVRQYVMRHYPQMPESRLRLIPRSMDPQQFPHGYPSSLSWRTQFDADFPNGAGKRWLCLPGRGTRLKGHAEALKLLAALRAQGHPLALVLLGAEQRERADYIEQLRRETEALGMSDHVVITPPRDDVRDVMANSSLVLQLSRRPEAFGRTVVEALNLGVPVLGWAHGGVGELLNELYPQGAVTLGDETALVERAQQILQAKFAPPASFEHYRLAEMQQATLAVYAELMAEKI